MKVFAVSPYFGEDDVLEIKIAEQAPFVDVFAFIEARTDHQGRPRELSWNHDRSDDAICRLADRWGAELRYDVVNLPSWMQPWEREGFQRESLIELTDDVAPGDVVIISDLDEVLRGDVISDLRDRSYTLPAQFSFPIHPYRLDYQWARPVEDGDCLCCAFSGKQYLELGPQRAAKDSTRYTILKGAFGWHFTYQGTPEQLVHKAESVADGWPGDLASLEQATRAIENGVDLFGRERPIRQVPVEELPVYVQENQARFRHLLRGGEVGHQEGTQEGAGGARP